MLFQPTENKLPHLPGRQFYRKEIQQDDSRSGGCLLLLLYHQKRKFENNIADEVFREMVVCRIHKPSLHLRNQGFGIFEGIDVIVPVPLTKKREKERGYNQSYHIAIGISEATGIPIITDAVRRVVFTESQTRKSKEERQTNVADAFRLVSSAGIEGKHVLLVDDVITTGATIFSCAGELLKGGVKCFSILSLAHTRHL